LTGIEPAEISCMRVETTVTQLFLQALKIKLLTLK